MSATVMHQGAGTMPQPRMEKVLDGIYAYVQLDGSWGLSNSGLVVGSRRAIVIDTLFTESRNRVMRAAIDDTAKVPVTTVVNTHHHADHSWGNMLYPTATIVAHELARTAAIEEGLGIQGYFPMVDFGDIDVIAPFATFSDRMNLYVDDDAVLEVHHVGPAHTTNDSVVWLPGQRVLFAGDAVFNGRTPFFVQGSLSGSIAAVERMKEFGPERIVPGHGTVCGPEALDFMLGYLRLVEKLAKQGFDAGLTPLQIAREADLGEFGEVPESERIVPNLYRAYSELRGEPLGGPVDLGSTYLEMQEFNGGVITCRA